MTSALLQRLAERALGLAPPLRSQLAVSGSGASSLQCAEPLEPAPDAIEPLGQRLEEARHAPVAPPLPGILERSIAPAEASLWPTPASGEGPLSMGAVAVAQPLEAAHPTAAPVRRRHAAGRAAPFATAATGADRPANSAAPQPDAPLEPAPTWHAPVALLPAQPAAQIAQQHDRPWGRERFEARTAQFPRGQPTEVQVRIGRVELTALAPTPGAARPTTRARDASPGLADYLRPGHKGNA